MRTVAALYVDPKGPYFQMEGVDAWDEERDAKLYNGIGPVVSHPPCGPWSKLAGLCTKQDKTCGPIAVGQVRRLGGVLEHPRHSSLFKHCRMALPLEMADAFGGRTYEVNQVAWGHPCIKPTWLYVVGVSHELVLSGIRTGGAATHIVCTGPGFHNSLPVASKLQKRLSPVSFAEWLVELARASHLDTCQDA